MMDQVTLEHVFLRVLCFLTANYLYHFHENLLIKKNGDSIILVMATKHTNYIRLFL
jgi:hypothetical protein